MPRRKNIKTKATEGGADTDAINLGVALEMADTTVPEAVPANPYANNGAKHRHTNKEILAAIMKYHGVMKVMAIKLGLARSALYARIDGNETLRIALGEAREGVKDLVEGKLIAMAMDGNEWAVGFYLRNQAKDRGYGEEAGIPAKVKIDLRVHSGDDDGEVIEGDYHVIETHGRLSSPKALREAKKGLPQS